MARSLHELAARIERWSGAASTPPPVAPPLPDPSLQALAERFPGAPEHWLRLVASRMGMGAIGAVTGASNPPAQPRRANPPMRPRESFPAAEQQRRRSLPFGFGRPKRGQADPNRAAATPPDRPATPFVQGEAEPRAPDRFADPSSPPVSYGPTFAANHRDQRFEPEFPSAGRVTLQAPTEPDHTAARERSGAIIRFPEIAPPRARDSASLLTTEPSTAPRFPAFADGKPQPGPSGERAFAPIGGALRSGYEVRQPGELHNIWPELPPSDLTIPDAQPMLPDEEAIRLEQMVARWSA